MVKGGNTEDERCWRGNIASCEREEGADVKLVDREESSPLEERGRERERERERERFNCRYGWNTSCSGG